MLAPYRLWSVWDMYRLNARKFVYACLSLSALSQFLVTIRQVRPPVQVRGSKHFLLEAREETNELRTILGDMGLPVSAEACQTVLQRMDDALANPQNESHGHFQLIEPAAMGIEASLIDLKNTLPRELESQYVLAMPFNKIKYYEQRDPLFGSDVATKFASAAAFEIDESGKCFSLNRYTATVFHLMRVMEVGITAARKSLGIPDPIKHGERNWGDILRKFDVELKARNAQQPKRWSTMSDEDFFAEVYVSLDAVRNVWRNSTMHVEKTYTEEEAEHIFSAVRGFMRKLASRVDENGLPLA